MHKVIKIGILGLGTIGGGTVSVLTRNLAEIERRTAYRLEITHAAALDYDKNIPGLDKIGTITDDASIIVSDPEINIIVELIGGCSLAREFVLKAIANGKHIVTANKALIAQHGNEILSAAEAMNVSVRFEASVGGGIPIIKSLTEGLTANKIESIIGIINGTTNYILSKMQYMGRDFQEILLEAQTLGYAEADPSFDINGTDAAHKLTILSAMAFGMPLCYEQVYKEGISHITQQDMLYTDELGYTIKHLGIAKRNSQGIECRVHPTLIPKDSLLANVDNVMNAVLIEGDAVGQTMYYGAGAGAEPTASAVIADLLDTIRVDIENCVQSIPLLGFQKNQRLTPKFTPISDIESAYYLRIPVLDKNPTTLAGITEIFSKNEINIAAVLQKEPLHQQKNIEIVLLTQTTQEQYINNIINKLQLLSTIPEPITYIRVESLAK